MVQYGLEQDVAKQNETGAPASQETAREAELETGLQTVSAEAAPPAPAAAPGQQAPKDLTKLQVQKACSRGLAGWLGMNRMSLAITSYQTGRIYLVGSDQQGRVSFFERIFESNSIQRQEAST